MVDRGAVAAEAFAGGEQERRWLEGLLWPLVGARIAGWLEHVRALQAGAEGCSRRGAAAVRGRDGGGVRRDDRRDRTTSRHGAERADGRGHALADERAARQLSQAQKAQRATFVVHNDGSVEDLRRELAEVLAKLSG